MSEPTTARATLDSHQTKVPATVWKASTRGGPNIPVRSRRQQEESGASQRLSAIAQIARCNSIAFDFDGSRVSRVLSTGFKRPSDLQAQCTAADNFTHPVHIEEFALAVSEAPCMGCPLKVRGRSWSWGVRSDLRPSFKGLIFQTDGMTSTRSIPELSCVAARHIFGRRSHVRAGRGQARVHTLVWDQHAMPASSLLRRDVRWGSL